MTRTRIERIRTSKAQLLQKAKLIAVVERVPERNRVDVIPHDAECKAKCGVDLHANLEAFRVVRVLRDMRGFAAAAPDGLLFAHREEGLAVRHRMHVDYYLNGMRRYACVQESFYPDLAEPEPDAVAVLLYACKAKVCKSPDALDLLAIADLKHEEEFAEPVESSLADQSVAGAAAADQSASESASNSAS